MLHLAVLNRRLALAGLHLASDRMVTHLLQMTDQALGELSRVQALADVIARHHPAVRAHLRTRHNLNRNPLNAQQSEAVINAARDTGADDAALRDMGASLGIAHAQMATLRITAPQRIPWGDARPIIEHTYAIKPRGDQS